LNKNRIYCFSGTGNCLDLAKNIARHIGGADIVMMRSAPVDTDARDARCVGFVFPCYGGGAPEDVLRFAKTIQVSPDAYTFGISQSSSYAGTGLAALNDVIPLRYWRAVTHQCSCIWLFPHTLMIPPLSPEKAQKRSEKLAREIAQDVLARRLSPKAPPKNALNAAENKAWPLIAKKKAAAFKVSASCIGCGQCARLCPRGNIRVEYGRAVIGRDCIQCLGCLQYCPQKAISLGKITDKREHYHNPNVSAEELCEKIISIS
jgi:ferredoxin